MFALLKENFLDFCRFEFQICVNHTTVPFQWVDSYIDSKRHCFHFCRMARFIIDKPIHFQGIAGHCLSFPRALIRKKGFISRRRCHCLASILRYPSFDYHLYKTCYSLPFLAFKIRCCCLNSSTLHRANTGLGFSFKSSKRHARLFGRIYEGPRDQWPDILIMQEVCVQN